MKKIIYMIMFILTLPVIFANFDLQINNNINIFDFDRFYGFCSYNGTNCPESTTCNLTVLYPNFTIWFNNRAMTQFNGTFIYEIASPTTTGIFPGKSVCCVASECDTSAFNINIFGNMIVNSCPQSIASVLLYTLFTLIIFGGIIIAIKIKQGIIGVISGIALIIMSTYLVGCASIIGWILIIIGAALTLYFMFQKWY